MVLLWGKNKSHGFFPRFVSFHASSWPYFKYLVFHVHNLVDLKALELLDNQNDLLFFLHYHVRPFRKMFILRIQLFYQWICHPKNALVVLNRPFLWELFYYLHRFCPAFVSLIKWWGFFVWYFFLYYWLCLCQLEIELTDFWSIHYVWPWSCFSQTLWF